MTALVESYRSKLVALANANAHAAIQNRDKFLKCLEQKKILRESVEKLQDQLEAARKENDRLLRELAAIQPNNWR